MQPVFCSVRVIVLLCVSGFMAGCSSTGRRTADIEPVLYPNAALNKMGKAAARSEVQGCMHQATSAGLHPVIKSNAASRGALLAGATTAVTGVVGGLVSGRGLEDSVVRGAKGAAVGAAAGATSGAIVGKDKVNPTYRRFVERCISEKGLEIVGWE